MHLPGQQVGVGQVPMATTAVFAPRFTEELGTRVEAVKPVTARDRTDRRTKKLFMGNIS